MIKTIFRALQDPTNPFYLIDKNAIIRRDQLIGRIKRVQSIILANNTSRIGIISNEILTSNVVVTYLAALFSGIDIVFLDKSAPVESIISVATRANCGLVFADATTIAKLVKNKDLTYSFVNIININNYSCKFKASLVPFVTPDIILPSLVLRDYIQQQCELYHITEKEIDTIQLKDLSYVDFESIPIKRESNVAAFNVHPHVMHFAVLNSILAGAILKLRTITDKGSILFIDGYDLIELAIDNNLNLMPIIERSLWEDTKLQFNNYLSKMRLKQAFKGKTVLVFNTEQIWDIIKRLKLSRLTRKGYRPNRKNAKTPHDIWVTNPKLAVELTARFNLPIVGANYVELIKENALFVKPDFNSGIENITEFYSKLRQFQELFNRHHQDTVTPSNRPVTIDHVILLPAKN